MPMNIIPESQAPGAPYGFGGDMQRLFSNPNFLSLLAGIGTNLDPEGVGGAIGRPTQQFIANQAAQKVGAKTLEQSNRLLVAHERTISALGGFSSSGTPGVTSAAVTKNNALKLEVDPKPEPGPNDVESLIGDSFTPRLDAYNNQRSPRLSNNSPLQSQVDDLLSDYLPKRPVNPTLPLGDNTEPSSGVAPQTAQQPLASIAPVNTTQPTQSELTLERPAKLALDSYRSLDTPMKERIHRAVDSALVQNPTLSKEELLSIIGIESHYQPTIQGPVTREGWRAAGLMQLSPGVIKKYAVADPFNVEANVNAGAAYYAELKAQYNGNQQLALAAYNAGPEAVKRHGNNVPGYPETRAYVSNVPTLRNVLRTENGAPAIVRDQNSPEAIDAVINPAPSPVAQSTVTNDPFASTQKTISNSDQNTAAQVQELLSTGVETAGVRGAPRSNLIAADDLRGLNPAQIDAIVGRAQNNTALAVQIAELTGQTMREIKKDLNARQLETRKAKLQAAKDISESSLNPAQQKAALERLGNTGKLDEVLELGITAAGLPKAANVGTDREAIASELFGSGLKYAQLDSTQQAKVNQELVARSTGGSEVVATEAGIFVVDKRTNTARQVTVAPGKEPIVGANQTPTTSTAPTSTTPTLTPPPGKSATLAPGQPLPGKEPARPTEDQSKSLNYGTRALAANDIISN